MAIQVPTSPNICFYTNRLIKIAINQRKLKWFEQTSYPFAVVKQVSESPKVSSRCRSCWASRSSKDWWMVSMWFRRNISLLRNDSSIRLKLVCTFVFACSHTHSIQTQKSAANQVLVISSQFFGGMPNFHPRRGICQFLWNLYVFTEFCRILY